MKPLLNAVSGLLLLALVGAWWMQKSGYDVPRFTEAYIIAAFAIVEGILWRIGWKR